jgi:hypothetical protein
VKLTDLGYRQLTIKAKITCFSLTLNQNVGYLNQDRFQPDQEIIYSISKSSPLFLDNCFGIGSSIHGGVGILFSNANDKQNNARKKVRIYPAPFLNK